MTSTKIFGLAALAALMAMAFVGASSAMATGSTALCKADENPCAAGNIITHMHETSVGKIKLLGAISATIECNVLFLGDALNGGLGNPLIIHGTFTYTSCNNFCTVTEENGPAVTNILKTATELASVITAFLIHLTCLGVFNCRYFGNVTGHGLGSLTSSSPNGSIVFAGAPVFLESGECELEAFLDLTLTPLIQTYISS